MHSLCYKLFATATYMTTEGRQPILNLAVAMQPRAWMQGLWDVAKRFELPASVTPLHLP